MFFRKFIKPNTITQAASSLSNAAQTYLTVSAATTCMGGGVGAALSVMTTIPAFLHHANVSKKENLPGKFVDGVEGVARIWGMFVGGGLLFGSAPVTYPIAKAVEYLTEPTSKP